MQGDAAEWDGSTPLKATLYADISDNINSLGVVVGYNKNHFFNTEVSPVEGVSIDKKISDETSGSLALLFSGALSGDKQPLAVIDFYPVNQVLSDTVLVLRSAAAKDKNGNVIDANLGNPWRISVGQ